MGLFTCFWEMTTLIGSRELITTFSVPLYQSTQTFYSFCLMVSTSQGTRVEISLPLTVISPFLRLIQVEIAVVETSWGLPNLSMKYFLGLLRISSENLLKDTSLLDLLSFSLSFCSWLRVTLLGSFSLVPVLNWVVLIYFSESIRLCISRDHKAITDFDMGVGEEKADWVISPVVLFYFIQEFISMLPDLLTCTVGNGIFKSLPVFSVCFET